MNLSRGGSGNRHHVWLLVRSAGGQGTPEPAAGVCSEGQTCGCCAPNLCGLCQLQVARVGTALRLRSGSFSSPAFRLDPSPGCHGDCSPRILIGCARFPGPRAEERIWVCCLRHYVCGNMVTQQQRTNVLPQTLRAASTAQCRDKETLLHWGVRISFR